MPLSLIVGPPNSGRAARIRALLEASLERDPVLVVPTGDDVSQFERDLCAGGGVALGASIGTFAHLVDDVAAAAGAPGRPRLSPAQRLALVRSAISETPLRPLGTSARRPGFAPALDRLLAELQGALVDPSELRLAAAEPEGGTYEDELAALFAAYLRLREACDRDDEHSWRAAATRALIEAPSAWTDRPVFIYGFDDLTEEQLELVRALSDACEVTVAVNFADRVALSARARLLSRLTADLEGEVDERLESDDAYTASATLRALDRGLFEAQADRVEPDAGLALLACAGERGEAEAVGARIARLLADGTRPDEIVVVLRNPDRGGALLGRTLGEYGIPVAVEADVPLARTAVGKALLALIRAASPQGTIEDLIALYRARPGSPPSIADGLERRFRREGPMSADEASASWTSPPRPVERLRAAGGGEEWLRELASLARSLAQEAFRGREPTVPASPASPPFEPIELRAGEAAAEVLEELGDLAEHVDTSRAAIQRALEDVTVALWRGPTDGRVRVLSPYRVRAARAKHLFLASLQDGEFPGHEAGDPLLGDERRSRLAVEALVRRDPGEEERYLFHACVSRPTERLWLCWRSCDEEGRPSARSPFVDDVLDLLEPDAATAAERVVHTRGLERVTHHPADAPSERELARSLAALGAAGDAPAALERLQVPADVAARIEARLDAALTSATAPLPGPLRLPEVLDPLAHRDVVGAGTLEKWLECPYRWFVDHELGPQRLEPEPEPLAVGSIAHEVLERLYSDPPGDESIPRPGDVGRWRRRALELLDEVASDRRLERGRPLAAIALTRVRAQLEGFLERESQLESTLRPAMLEAGFGDFDDSEREPLELGDGLRLRGSIDRVDTTPDGTRGVIYDYKSSASVPAAGKLAEEGKLQPQLYALALRDRWGIDPIGALYVPLGAREKTSPRGFALKGDPATDALPLVRTDRLEEDDLQETLDAGHRRALETGSEMRRGEIGRRPLNGECPRWCRYQPICRLERSPIADGALEAEE